MLVFRIVSLTSLFMGTQCMHYILNALLFIFSDIAEDEQLIRRNLMSLHRAINQKDRILLSQLAQAGIDMTLPLKGVTALSLTLYLKYTAMTIAVLDALKQANQISKSNLGYYMVHNRLIMFSLFLVFFKKITYCFT